MNADRTGCKTPDDSQKNAVCERQNSSRENNFAIIRYLAAIFVFAGHMGNIMGITPPLLAGIPLHELGVMVLFLISGYLITKSWMSDPNLWRFWIRRFFRLWPPFAVTVLVLAIVAGPLVSELGVKEYFQSGYSVYLKNLRFYVIYALPGVFRDLPVANAVNGSLWTMPVEAALYIVTPFILMLLGMHRKKRLSFVYVAILTMAGCAFDLYLRVYCVGKTAVLYATDWIAAFHLITFYLIGIFFTCEEVRKFLNVQVGVIAMCLLLLCQRSSAFVLYLSLYLVFPYFVFSVVFAPKPVFHKVGRRVELSYGIYLYGFFFQQLAVQWQQQRGISLGYTKTLILSFIPTLIAAVCSYYLIERPAIRLGRVLTEKLKQKGSA